MFRVAVMWLLGIQDWKTNGPVPIGFDVPPFGAASMEGAATYPVCACAR